ncbi:MAG: DUF1697 domain-containing protein [Prevotellaceae bacterium]|jgi:uncharacterized protein (DUF1697 family)|nr:DUF1697 domain-containing protein [Prevotellaceae bacterium]
MKKNEIYVALLRGINVGGNNVIRMDRLKNLFEQMGFESVLSYIPSGNIIFRAEASNKQTLTQRIEKCMSKQFSNDVRVLILTAAELRTIVANAPANFDLDNSYQYYVWFLMPPLTPAALLPKLSIRNGVDKVFEGENVVYVSRMTYQATKSFLTKVSEIAEYQHITIRKWNTTTKILDLTDSI